MRRVLLAVATLLAVAGGIAVVVLTSGGEDPAVPPDPDPTAEPEPEPEPEAEPIIAPLTGEAVQDPAVPGRSVVALKVDNAPQARPQVGLEDADILFTELVEGGTTRFIGLYHSAMAEGAGPVRSGRDVDAQVLPPFSPVFGISGAAPGTYEALRGAGLLVYEEGQAGAFTRDPNRVSPHDLMASTSALANASGDLPPAAEPWPFDPAPPAGGEPATGVELIYSAFYAAAWNWDASVDTWRRSQEGGPHVDADEEQLTADTIVVARVTTSNGPGVDVGGNPVPEVNAVGEGEATILRDGRSYPARWRKPDATSQFEWLTPEGQVLPLRPGRTWVELVPEAGSVSVATTPGAG